MDIKAIVEQSKASIEKKDLEIFLTILEPMAPKIIVELGGWRGYSGEIWIKAFQPKKFVSLEKDINTPIPEDPRFWYGDSHLPETKQKIVDYLGGEKIDFLFIDADHSYEGVKKDWEMYSPLVRKGAIVVFHDVCYQSDDPLAPVQVKIFWDHIKIRHLNINNRNNYVEICSSNLSTGMGILYV